MVKIPLATFKKLIKEVGGDMRVSNPAAKEMTVAVGEIGRKIAGDAVTFARHTGRKTVTEEDIKLAYKNLLDEK
jgi:histone H3/H4